MFFGILEMLSDEFDIHNPGKLTIRMKKITKNLQLSRQKTVKILRFFDEKAKINSKKDVSFFAEIGKVDVVINCKRLARLCDNHTQKLLNNTLKSLRSKDEVTSLQRSKNKEERSKNKEIKMNKPEKKPASKINKLGNWIDQNKGMNIYIIRFEKNLWPKIRTAIGEALKKDKHSEAIKDLIIYIYKHRNIISDPQTYFWGTLNKISGNYYEQENISKHEKVKSEEIPTIGSIFERMTAELKEKQ